MRLTHRHVKPSAAAIRVRFDGHDIEALPGETIAAALAAAGVMAVRQARSGAPRGPFCGMGVCFDCLVTVDGRPNQRACLTRIEAGMEIRSGSHGPISRSAAADRPPPIEYACDVLVVGAGPAGLSAARRLARAGADVIVADERLAAGGQYFKPLASSHAAEVGSLDRQFQAGENLRQSALASGVRIITEATVWAAFTPQEIAAIVAGRGALFRARRLVLATGAYEQAWPVPGWTLPGVMTVGGLQTLARSYRVSPGRRIVIAGNGPLSLQAAIELVEGGATVAAVIEAAPRPGARQWKEVAAASIAAPSLMADGARLLARLRSAAVPIHWGRAVTRILGVDRVLGVEIASSTVEADVVALGYGFSSSSELARSMGCAHRFVARGNGSMETLVDGDGRTSVPDVFAIGDGARFGGAHAALAWGELAAAAICGDLGLPVDAQVVKGARRSAHRAARFQAALWHLFEAPPFDPKSIEDDAIVCRCEEVTAGDLRRLIGTGYETPAALKRMCRVGMGRCQGRYCAALVARLGASADAGTIGEFGLFAPRPPAKPVPIGALGREQDEWGGHREIVPPNLARPSEVLPLPTERVDALVIGGGVMGACVAYWLARERIDTLLVDRDDLNLQASGSNAGSLHVQLLSFDFGPKAQAGGGPAASTLPLGPASVALWREIAAEVGDDLELGIVGGLMLAETDREIAFLKAKIALERTYGIDAELIGVDDLRRLEPALGEAAIAAEYCPAEGKINPLRATFAVAARARTLGARFRRGSDVRAIVRTGGFYRVTTSRGDIICRRIVNAAGAWTPQIAAMVGIRVPVKGAPLQMIVTEPAPPIVRTLVAHADRHLSLKQMASGAFVIGGGWTAELDERQKLSRALRSSVEGNLWVASRVLPALADLHAIRIWAGMNVNVDGAPILGEAPGMPGFFNCVSSNGYTLAPVLARLTAEMMAGRSTSLPVLPYSLMRFS